MTGADENRARLLVSCPDRHGIVAAVSAFLLEQNANIIDSDQHSTADEGGEFFLRMEFAVDDLQRTRAALEARFAAEVASRFAMGWRFSFVAERKRVAIFASREDHCLLDLLWRRRRGELAMEVVAVVSNHPDPARDVELFGVPFHHIPVDPGRKEAAEARALELLVGQVDFVVLARYMRTLPANMVNAFRYKIINIHHSFLPAFTGGNPYARAHDRGVKLIGATAHYATDELDEGPIIEQDVARVSHRQEVRDLVRIGRDIERVVLARAVSAHLDDRVLVHGNRTVVF